MNQLTKGIIIGIIIVVIILGIYIGFNYQKNYYLSKGYNTARFDVFYGRTTLIYLEDSQGLVFNANLLPINKSSMNLTLKSIKISDLCKNIGVSN